MEQVGGETRTKFWERNNERDDRNRGLAGQRIKGSVAPHGLWQPPSSLPGLTGLALTFVPSGDIRASIACRGGILAQVEWCARQKGVCSLSFL